MVVFGERVYVADTQRGERVQGNGIDIGAVYQLLTEVAQKVTEMDARITAVDARITAMDARVTAMDARITAVHQELADFREQVTHDISNLRQTVALYHDAVIGQGIHYSGIERRVQRIERHLGLQPEHD
jgi:hypothetical protein